MRCSGRVALVALAMTALPALAEAQGRMTARQGQDRAHGRVSRSDLQDQFDAYAIVQAQEALRLSDEQYPEFVRRARALHATRRRMQVERTRLVDRLGRLLRSREVDEQRLEAATRALDAHEREAFASIQKAYAEVDAILDTRQRARFRVLEQQLEQKKLDILMRVRQRR